jgi:hypothetical protein
LAVRKRYGAEGIVCTAVLKAPTRSAVRCVDDSSPAAAGPAIIFISKADGKQIIIQFLLGTEHSRQEIEGEYNEYQNTEVTLSEEK